MIVKHMLQAQNESWQKGLVTDLFQIVGYLSAVSKETTLFSTGWCCSPRVALLSLASFYERPRRLVLTSELNFLAGR